LSQVGEFSFILAKTGSEYSLINSDFYQMFLAVSILTMAVTPFLISYSPRISEMLLKLPFPKKIKEGRDSGFTSEKVKLKDHLVIIGFGITGRNLALAAKASNIPYTILEMNPDTVKEAKKLNEPIHFGDAAGEELLHAINISEARIAAIAINDHVAVRKIVRSIKLINKDIYLIVRTRYVKEMDDLHKIGADEVIPEEYETSIEIFSRVLAKYLVPQNEIQRFIESIRLKDYSMFRKLSKENGVIKDIKLNFPDVEILSFRIAENSELADKTLSELDFRNKYNATILGVIRDTGFVSNPPSNFVISKGDALFLLANHENLQEIKKILS
jgi:CPA2 family monovalent cation:H+ antiporter-2